MRLVCSVVTCWDNEDGRCSDEMITACSRRFREMEQVGVLESRVEDLIENYMNHYEVTFEEAKEIMIEDIKAAEGGQPEEE